MKKLLSILSVVLLYYSSVAQEAFIRNDGQWTPGFLYKKNLAYGGAFFFEDSIVYNFVNRADVSKSAAHNGVLENFEGILHLHSITVEFLKTSDEKTRIVPEDERTDYLNYFIGRDPSKWRSRVPHFNILSYYNLYEGVKLRFYSDDNTIKYEFIANDAKAVRQIRYRIKYADKVWVNADGELKIATSVNEITEPKPFAYQRINGERKEVECKFVVHKNIVGFKLGKVYDKNSPVIIDPYLIFSTYSGSESDNWGFTATYDFKDRVYSGGIAFATGYPVSPGAFQVSFAGGHGYSSGYYQYGCDIAIIKYSPDGTQRLFATYLGGSNSEELPHSLVVDKHNHLIVMGVTGSNDFPVTSGAYDATYNGGDSLSYDNVIVFQNGTDIYVSKFSEDGTHLLASTLIGGSKNDGLNFRVAYASNTFIMTGADTSLYFNYADGARGEVTVDDSGYVYVSTTTFSDDFPDNAGFSTHFRGKQEGVVFKLAPDFDSLLWSGYLSGTEDDALYSVDLASDGRIYVGGGTRSNDLPVNTNAYQSIFKGKVDGYVAAISNDGHVLEALSYFGSTYYDQIYFVRVGRDNYPYVTGQTKAPDSTFIYNALYSNPNSGQFIAKLTPNLNALVWSTVVGSGNGRPNISITAFEVDVCNRIYLSGWGREWAVSTTSWDTIQGTKNMPLTSNAYRDSTDGQDFYLMVMDGDANYLDYATYFGELHYASCGYSGHDHVDGGTSRFNKRGHICQAVCASCGGCQQFPTYPDSVWSVSNNAQNCNNAVFKFSFVDDIVTAQFYAPQLCPGDTVVFTNTSQNGQYFQWDFGDGTTSTAFQPSHYYSQGGTYTVTLIAVDSGTCNISDTVSYQITIPEPLNINVSATPQVCQVMGSASVQVSGGLPPLTYEWSNGVFGNSITAVEAGTYQVTVTDANHCKTVLQVTVPDSSYPVSVTGVAETQKCDGICNGSVAAEINGAHTPYSFMWNTGDTDQTLDNLCEGDYIATLVDANGCSDTLTLHVGNEHLEPDIDVSSDTNDVFPGTQVNLFVTDSSDFSYLWSGGENIFGATTPTATVAPSHTTTYYVTVTDQYGCQARDSITIRVLDVVCGEPYIYVPNAFSPNGDGQNDVLYVYANPALITKLHLMIYDRWGELVFETESLDKGWDGTYKGRKLDPAVFVYYLEATCINDETFVKKGNITLLK